jgi:hypothetical protein
MPREKKTTRKKKPDGEYWSARVTRESNALDLDSGVFTWKDPARIARSLKASADRSTRRKAADPFRSAMSMLVFFMNRAGSNLSSDQAAVLNRAKVELRKEFGRPPKD